MIRDVVSGSQSNVIEHEATAELTASMALFDRVQIGLALPYTPVLKGQLFDSVGVPTGQDESARGLGDLRVEAKTQLAVFGEDEQYGVGLLAGVSVPTAKFGGASLDVPVGKSTPYYLGDKNFTGRIKGIFGLQIGAFRAAANLGVLLRESSQSFAAVVGSQVLYGAAGAVEVRDRVELMVELYGRSGLDNFTKFYSDVNPFEADLALRVGVTSMLSISVGGGRGFGKGIGAPAGRGFLAAGFAPDFRDRDHDGVYDVDDRCPDQPEDMDGFQDNDGCPDLDNDNDGIPDAEDKCPNAAEDEDSSRTRTAAPSPTTTRTASPTSTTRARTRPRTAAASDPPTAARRRPRTATATASTTRSTSAPTSPRIATASRTTTVAPTPTMTTTASPTASTTAPTKPRMR